MSNRHNVTLESLEALVSGDKDRLCAVVHAHIRKCRGDGTTDDAMSEALDLPHNSVAPRRNELEDAGLVTKLFDSNGQRVRRKTRQGCFAGVYVVTEFAPVTSVAHESTMVHVPPSAPPSISTPRPARADYSGDLDAATSQSQPIDARADIEFSFSDLAPERHRDDG